MKRCTYCGKEYSDEVEVCPTDGQPVQRPGAAQTAEPAPPVDQTREAISPEEQRFWERMTFRQFAILIVRLQALWMFFYAAVEATYLPRYFTGSSTISAYSALSPASKREFFLLIFRILMHVAAAVAVIQYTEKVLSWLVKDCFTKQAPGQAGG